jgi:N-methylhydantoinase B
MVEAKYPVTFIRYGLISDSGGGGEFRGGLGLVREWRLDAPAGVLATSFERFRHPPYGLAGGKPGSLSCTTVTRADGSSVSLPSKVSGFALHAGDIVTIETSGGGGFGDPRRRDPARVARDVSEGLVTAEQAAAIYDAAQP